MIFENFMISIVEQIHRTGYEAFIVGRSIAYKILEKPTEEYEIFTSAPLFSIPKYKKEKRSQDKIVIEEFYKKVTIFSGEDLNGFLKKYNFVFEQLAYHLHHGIMDNFSALEEIEQRKITLNSSRKNPFPPICFFEAIYLCNFLNFTMDYTLENQLKTIDVIPLKNSKDLISKFLLLNAPGSICKAYPVLSKTLFHTVEEQSLKLLDYLKADVVLRLTCLLKDQAETGIERLIDWGYDRTTREQVSLLLEWLSFPLHENSIVEFIQQKTPLFIKNWFSIKRAECLLDGNELLEIHRLDQLERCALEELKKREEKFKK